MDVGRPAPADRERTVGVAAGARGPRIPRLRRGGGRARLAARNSRVGT